MKHISILVPEGDVSITNIEGTHQIFSQVNSFLLRAGRQPLFTIQLVGLNKETRMKKGLFSVHPDVLIDDNIKTDLIIIPAIQESDMKKALEANQDFIPWLIKQYKSGAEIASLCIGSFLLASTGLLKGRKCATHWVAANDFRSMFPDVHLVTDRIITDEQGIYSSGGAYSSLNLILYLVEKFAGREMAILCSKVFQIEIERNSQSSFMIFNPQKEHKDEAIKQAQEFIEHNVGDKISVEDLASKCAVGRRNFERRFKKATSNTPAEYLQRVKIEAAKKSLETSRKNVNEVMYEVGYADTKAFRTIFRKITGLSPIEYRNKYNKEAVPA
ncbi:GlxA family transcriptional regulator [Segetibacter koreensis]|uniref:GlxA family transcriptional regulator n=1 Tax=Segetibacter koreensis TaxID=398037 RepID=UPI000368F8FC|nr:helix-turn-helix domain-containing protein [Segetibacter koreensis]